MPITIRYVPHRGHGEENERRKAVKKLTQVIGSFGLILFFLGAAAMDSPSLYIPVAMCLTGLFIALVAEKMDRKIDP